MRGVVLAFTASAELEIDAVPAGVDAEARLVGCCREALLIVHQFKLGAGGEEDVVLANVGHGKPLENIGYLVIVRAIDLESERGLIIGHPEQLVNAILHVV